MAQPPPYPPGAAPYPPGPSPYPSAHELSPAASISQPQVTKVVVKVPKVEQTYFVSHEPQIAVCSNCRAKEFTNVRKEKNNNFWIYFIILVVIVCPLAFLPFLMDSCHDAYHHCGKCGNFLGIHRGSDNI